MRVVSYTRSTSCLQGEDIPKNVIGIQNEHITAYAKMQGWAITQKYSDRKVDIDEDAAFQQLLADGISRKFDVVIVDSVFRAGKSIGSAKEVLLQTFHMAGIFFVVVEDDYCSIGKSNEDVESYFESKYSDYRTITMRHKIADRHARGFLTWNDGKYGYHLNADYQLEVDDETSPVVKRIFEECAAGKDIKQIAAGLREDGILCPIAKRGTNVKVEDPYKWTSYGVKRIIRNTAYYGQWVKMFKGVEYPMECEPIVSKELFDEANSKIIQAPSPQIQRVKNKFAGLIVDENFRPTMRYRESKYGERYFYTMTGLRHNNPRIRLEEVEKILREYLRKEHEFALLVRDKIRIEGQSRIEEIYSRVGLEITTEAAKVAELEKRRINLYRQKDKSEEALIHYETFVDDTVGAYAQIEKAIQACEKKIAEAEILYSEKNPWLQLFMKYDENSEQTKEMLQACLQRIVFRKVEIIRIEFSLSEWRDRLPEEWRCEYGA